jgi:hypothetical protein
MGKRKSERTKLGGSLRKKILPRVALVFFATALAFFVYHRIGPGSGQNLQHQRENPHVRKYVIDKKGLAPRAEEDVNLVDTGDGVGFRQESNSSEGLFPTGAEHGRTEPTNQRKETNIQESKKSVEPDTSSEKPDYSDAEPPSLISVQFDPKESPPGANVLVFIQATDNLSGVDSISGKVKSPSGVAVLSFRCQRSDNEESFVGAIEIPDRAEMGTWSIRSLRLTDRVKNTKTYSERDSILGNAHFQIIESDSDNVPPIILDVFIDPSEIRAGEKVQLNVEVEDDKSGVSKIHGALRSPSNNARLSFVCRGTSETNLFYGDVTMPKDAESGEWALLYIRVEDEAKNSKTYYRQSYPEVFDNATVRVHGDSSDSQPPTLDDVAVYPGAVAYQESVEIIVSASDDISGVSRITGRLRSPSGKARIPFSCVSHGDSEAYRAEVKIQPNTEVGLWGIEYIRMIDKARNQIVYGSSQYPLVEEATFEVIGE